MVKKLLPVFRGIYSIVKEQYESEIAKKVCPETPVCTSCQSSVDPKVQSGLCEENGGVSNENLIQDEVKDESYEAVEEVSPSESAISPCGPLDHDPCGYCWKGICRIVDIPSAQKHSCECESSDYLEEETLAKRPTPQKEPPRYSRSDLVVTVHRCFELFMANVRIFKVDRYRL